MIADRNIHKNILYLSPYEDCDAMIAVLTKCPISESMLQEDCDHES